MNWPLTCRIPYFVALSPQHLNINLTVNGVAAVVWWPQNKRGCDKDKSKLKPPEISMFVP